MSAGQDWTSRQDSTRRESSSCSCLKRTAINSRLFRSCSCLELPRLLLELSLSRGLWLSLCFSLYVFPPSFLGRARTIKNHVMVRTTLPTPNDPIITNKDISGSLPDVGQRLQLPVGLNVGWAGDPVGRTVGGTEIPEGLYVGENVTGTVAQAIETTRS